MGKYFTYLVKNHQQLKINFNLIFITVFCSLGYAQESQLPEGFVYVKEIIPDIILEVRYAGSNNFVGRPINGYKKPRAILTLPAAEALQKVQAEVQKKGYCLKIFDAYRPQRAVDHFIAWAKDEGDTLQKQGFYPNIKKGNLFQKGYIATKSGHSRGSTVDITLVDYHTGEEIDMGSSYDFFGEISHHNSKAISKEQRKNREFLKKMMEKHGFQSYFAEWWHYSLRNEAFPGTYFNFVVE